MSKRRHWSDKIIFIGWEMDFVICENHQMLFECLKVLSFTRKEVNEEANKEANEEVNDEVNK